MSQGKGFHNKKGRNYHQGNKQKVNIGDKGKEILENIDENNAIISQFRLYAAELDSKHDRYERIVKYSRDITIESKRIIFLLHSIDKESKREGILNEAKTRLDNLAKTLFKNIAVELYKQDGYQYLRAYTAGLQEYVEAMTFYNYLKTNNISDWQDLEKSFTYNVELPVNKDPSNGDDGDAESMQISTLTEVNTLITPNDYILGIADLTGELMRKCINNLSSGDIQSCFQICNLVKEIYKGFLGCSGISGKEVRRKIYVLKQSLIKMENVCYTIKVRGSEIPKHMLIDAAIVAAESYHTEDDEGYQVY